MSGDAVHIGIDFGTGGVRCCAIDHDEAILGETSDSVTRELRRDPDHVLTAVKSALSQLARITGGSGDTFAIAGTSGSFLSLGAAKRPVAEISLYCDRASGSVERPVQVALSAHAAMGASNAGGMVLRHLFTDTDLASLSRHPMASTRLPLDKFRC